MEKNILKSNIAIILVEPQLGENIGTTARAMLNFGFENLILVNPRDDWPNDYAIKAAAGAIKVINRADESVNSLETLETINGHFISVNEISKILSNRAPFVNNEREKIVLYVRDSRVKITANTSFILVDDRVFQLPTYCLWINGDLYIAATSFFEILKRTILPGISFLFTKTSSTVALRDPNEP